MRVLFTTPILEHPPAGGPTLRIETSIKALSRVSELFLVPRVSKTQIGGDAAETFYKGFCRGYGYASSTLAQPPGTDPVALDGAFLASVMDQHALDVLWCGFGNISFPLIRSIKAARPQTRVVCDTDSVWSRFVLRELPLETDPARRAHIEAEGRQKEQEERLWTQMCDVTTAVSEVDADYYRSLTDRPEHVHIFSNVIDLDTYTVRPASPPGFRGPSLFLAGSFYAPTSPMVRAARWVLAEVLPRVRAAIPDAHLYIVGNMSDVMLADVRVPGVTITGKLPSVLPYLCNADVALVPLMFESGTRFKILEAGACRIPVVSTVLGAEGIPVTHGKDILLANDPDKFAHSIVRVIHDKVFANSLAGNLHDMVQKNYSIDTLTQQAAEILHTLA